jgi:hypothetical protein
VVAECLALRAKETEYVDGTVHAGFYHDAKEGVWASSEQVATCAARTHALRQCMCGVRCVMCSYDVSAPGPAASPCHARWGCVLRGPADKDLQDLNGKVFTIFMSSNMLFPGEWRGAARCR